MFHRFFCDFRKYWRYCVYSTKAQLKSEVANSYLSWVWWLLEPFCFMLIYSFMYGTVFNAKEQYFSIFIFIGTAIWGFFSKCMTQSVKLVRMNKPIVSKVYLPKFILVVTKIMVNGFKMLLTFIIVIAMLIFFRVPVSLKVLYVIPILITLVLITFGLSCFLCHFGVFVDDLTNVVNIALRFLMYMTGIFYNIMKRMPAPYNTIIVKLNPIAYLLQSFRQCVLYDITPGRKLLLAWFFVGLVISAMGVRLIYKYENSYVKLI